MRSTITALLLALTVAACSDDDPTAPTAIDGLRLSAEVTQNLTFFSVQVTVENTTNADITRTLSLSCPVGIQFLAVQGGAIQYDETDRDCGTLTNQVTIPARQSVVLTSGQRFIPTLAQTVSVGSYNVRAFVRFDGGEFAPVNAGLWRLPDCRQVGLGTVCD
jgi:hypothetical protein